MPEYTLGELAHLLSASLKGGDSATIVSAVAPLSTAHHGQLSFLVDAKYRQQLQHTKASAVLVSEIEAANCSVPCLVVENPAVRFIQVAKLFETPMSVSIGIHPTSVIGEACVIDATVSIGPHCAIGKRVTIGRRTVIGAGTVIGDDVTIGDDSLLHAHVTVYRRTVMGSRVIIHGGVVMGSDGFGNVNQEGQWLKSPQLGKVRIGDDVEIGANTTIDCGALEDTIVEDGVKLDNLIQIGHNVHTGAHTAMAAQVGVAGSTKIGRYCMIGGKVAINGHITICDHVILTATTAVNKSITTPGVYSSGIPADAHSVWSKNVVRFGKLNEMYKRLLLLEQMLVKKED